MYAHALWDLAEDGGCPFDGDNMFEEGSGPDQDFHIMVLILVRKKKVTVSACGWGLGVKQQMPLTWRRPASTPEKARECSVPGGSQPSGEMDAGNAIWNV